MKCCFQLCSFVLILLPIFSSTSKLNVPRVLLPVFKSISVNFSLEVSGIGCYIWSSSRPDLVAVNVEQGLECSRIAAVSVVTQDFNRNTVVVVAQEKRLGHILRADIILDVINSLSVVTKTRTLHLDEPPELFEIAAKDKHGNVFTSLDGVEFQWSITSSSKVVRLMTFKESLYETPEGVRNLERMGKRGHLILLEGLLMGYAKVGVKLPYAEYDDVHEESVSINVVTNIILQPFNAIISIGDTIKYKLVQVKGGKFVEIDTLSTHFYLRSTEDLVEINEFEITGVKTGHTIVELHDLTVHDIIESIKEVKVTVVYPKELTLSVSPDFSIISGEPATITSTVYAEDGGEIMLGNHFNFSIDIPPQLFIVSHRLENGTVINGRGGKPGNGIVNGTVTIHSNIYKTVLKASVNIFVYPELSVTPNIVVFPWHKTSNQSYSVVLKASGGDGTFSWNSDDLSVATIVTSGEVSVIPTGIGYTNAHVYMKGHIYGKANCEIYVIEPITLELYKPISQVEVGETAEIYLKVKGVHTFPNGTDKLYSFTNCHLMEFKIKIENGFHHLQTIPNIGNEYDACAIVTVASLVPTVSTIYVSLVVGEKNTINRRTVIAAYERFTVLEPASKTTTLAVGSSRHLVFNGGPIQLPCRLIRTISDSHNIWSYNFESDMHNHYVIRVTCEKLGTGNLRLTLRTDSKCRDTSLLGKIYTASVEIICSAPAVISMRPIVQPDCPHTLSNTVIVTKHSVLVFHLLIMASDGHKFDNATSLHYKWTLDNFIGLIEQPDVVHLNYTEKVDYIVPGEHYKMVEIHDKTGEAHIKLVCFENHLEAKYDVVVINEPKVHPSFLIVYNHPGSSAQLAIFEGSGFYNLSVEPEQGVEAKYDSVIKRIIISPLADGEGTVTVIDRCITNFSLVINYQVISHGELRIELPEKVERGSKFEAKVQLFAKEDYPLMFPDLDVLPGKMSLNVGFNLIVEIVQSKVDRVAGIIRYTLKALEVGETTIQATWKKITSQQYQLQVFPPVKISTRPLILAVGAELQLAVSGGPSPDPRLQFTSSDSSVGTITPSAIVRALHVGTSIITVHSYSKEGTICSKDSVELSVVLLSGVQIKIPILQLGIGRVMPAWPTGMPFYLSPLILGSISPSLSYKWSVSLPGVVRLKDVLSPTNIEITNEDRLSVHVLALNPGRTTIFLTVTGRNPDRIPFVFNSSVEVEVIDTLEWNVPSLNHATLLVAPNTRFKVSTNRDREENIVYEGLSVAKVDESWRNDKNLVTALVPQGNILEIVSSDTVVVGPHAGLAIVQAKSTSPDTFSQQIISFSVQVKPVYYIMANIITELEVEELLLNHLPQGLNLVINVTYHDQYGSVFYSAPASIHGKSNCFDKIHISLITNSSLEVSLQKTGSTVINIFDDLSSEIMTDYIKLPVGNHIHPNKTWISFGEVICFWTPVGGGHVGTWKTDSDVISVTDSGLGIANKLGTAVMTFSLSSANANILSTVVVEVLPVITVQFGSSLPALTNSELGAKFIVPIRLVNEKERRDTFGLRSGRCHSEDKVEIPTHPFSCELRFNSVSVPLLINDVFTVNFKFDTKTGEMVCEITVKAGPTHEQSMLNSNVTLRVTVPHVTPESAVLQFNPAYFVHSNHVYLNQDQNSATILLTASPNVIRQIQIDSSEPSFLTFEIPALKFKSTYEITVMIDRSLWTRKLPSTEIFISIYSPLTNQRKKMTVIFEKEPLKADSSFSLIPGIPNSINQFRGTSFTFTIIGTILMMIIIAICIQFQEFQFFRPSPQGNWMLGTHSDFQNEFLNK